MIRKVYYYATWTMYYIIPWDKMKNSSGYAWNSMDEC